MKKLIAILIVSALVLSGCGLFGSNHAWKEAKQQNPLQIPPDLDRPATSDALHIPPPSDVQATPEPSTASANPLRMHVSDDVETAYQRVGLALQPGDLGTLVAQNQQQHTFQLSVGGTPDLGDAKGGFLQKHFSNLNRPQDEGAGSALTDTASKGAMVMIKVLPADDGGSIIRARGDRDQAVRIISALRGRLGG